MRKISSKELKNKIDSNEDIIILDVRDEDDYKEGHIKNSIFMPVGDISHEIEDIVQDKDTMICVYCFSGARSARAAMMLDYLEYNNVCDLGGITDWSYELEK